MAAFKKLFFLLFISLLQFLPAQTIKNFSSLGGKKDLGAKCIAQANEGILWLGTKEGLVKFDGKNSVLFRKEEGLANNDITSLFTDSKNNLWIGHRNGKISIKYKNKIDTFFLNAIMPPEEVISFFEDRYGNIFIGTHGGGLVVYNGKKLEKFTSGNGLADDIIYSMAFDGKKYLWIGTDAGISQMDIYGSNKEFAHLSMKTGLPDNIVRCIKNTNDGNMLIAMQDSGLCYFNLEKNKFIRNPFLSSWNLGAITDVVKRRDGSLLISSENKGLLSINGGKLKLTDASSGLPGNNVNKLFIDKEENLWVATSRGLSLIYQQRHLLMNSSMGLPSEKISCVMVDDDETIWTGSEKGVSEIMLDETGNFKLKNLLQDMMGEGAQMTSIIQADENHIFLGTYGKGIVIIDAENGNRSFLDTKKGLANDNISFMYKDNTGNIWVATLGGGISVINPKNHSIKNYTEADGLGSNYVYQVIVDSKQRAWAAVDGGGLELLEGSKFSNVNDKLKLQSKTVYSATEDAKGNIWFVTSDEGVVKYDGKTARIFTGKNGLRDAAPVIISASGNKIILVHNKGVDVVEEGHSPEVTYFDVSDNDLEPNLNAVYTSKDGTCWFGSNTGVVKFRAHNIASDTIVPNAYITNLKVQYKDYSLDSTNELSYKQNNFIFDFDATWLKAPDKIKFRFRLDGIENDWQQITANKMATYNNVPPGEYTFLVEACNEEGLWGPATTYKFHIATPIWYRWWFWVTVIVIMVTGIYFFTKYRLKALEKENLLLEEKVNERTAEIVKQTKVIEEKNKELEQLSLVASKTDNVVLIMDQEGKIEYVNDSFTKLNGLTFEELLNERGETIYEVSNHPQIKEMINEAVREKKSINYESLNVTKSGEKVWESSTFTPIYNESGELKKMIIIDTDVTERKKQEEVIVQKNRDITDSIQYAQKIQKAILPDINFIKQDIPHSFILYLIKDIVSGDFYWYSHKEGFGIIAAVDCTGHGVPGAFMSMIGYNILNQVVNEKNITEPARILTELNKGVIQSLHKKDPANAARDGMDVAICKINSKTHEIEYSAAMRPLWIIGKNESGTSELKEIKADKIPIGTLPENETYHQYHNHNVKANKDDMFYIFTDGYADQFGGEKGKKLTTGRFKETLIKIHDQLPGYQENKLLQEHNNWKGEQEQVDDILVIGFKA